jgi:hypothetical protein
VDHIIVLGEMHLRRVLKSYADHYNSVRTHRSLNKDAPVTRQIQRIGSIKSHASLADFTTTTPELKFSVHTGRGFWMLENDVKLRLICRSDHSLRKKDTTSDQKKAPNKSGPFLRAGYIRVRSRSFPVHALAVTLTEKSDRLRWLD